VAVNGPKDLATALGLKKIKGRLNVYVWQAANEIGKIAQDEGRWVIEHSATKGDWSKRFRKNPRWEESVRRHTGRVETGDMRDSYTYAVKKKAGGYKIDVGWIHGDPGYFEEQEWGFVWTGFQGGGGVQIDVPGMFAQDRSQPVVEELAMQALDKLEGRLNAE
jgi:hypothetical protein